MRALGNGAGDGGPKPEPSSNAACTRPGRTASSYRVATPCTRCRRMPRVEILLPEQSPLALEYLGGRSSRDAANLGAQLVVPKLFVPNAAPIWVSRMYGYRLQLSALPHAVFALALVWLG